MIRRSLLVTGVVLFAVSLSVLLNSAFAGDRKMKASIDDPAKGKFGNVLKGAVISKNITVTTTAGTGDATVAAATFGSGANQLSTSGVTINSSPQNIALTGVFGAYDRKVKVTPGSGGVLTVSNAKTTQLKIKYSANVGWAYKITKKPLSMTDFSKSLVLSADVAAGAKMVGLASKVGIGIAGKEQKGTLAGLSTAVTQQVLEKKNSKGVGLDKWDPATSQIWPYLTKKPIGSEAEIVDSTALASAATVKMSWRQRTDAEAHATPSQVLPRVMTGPTAIPDQKWLSSDVVKIENIAADVTYALQMTFDNRINLSFEGPVNGTNEQQWRGLFIAKLDNTGTAWERVALGSGHFDSLSDFIAANSGKTLDELEGNWGVDDTAGVNKSWAIIKGGGGIFAVVPEPATVIMMVSAVIGAMTYGWRRWSRKQQLPA